VQSERELLAVSVLIVDDDDTARETLSAVIEAAGYSVTSAANGREAIDRLGSVRPELILLDLCMPEMDGATFRQEQRRHWDWLHIPTVVMTGADEEMTLDVAVSETLKKPINSSDLLSIVARHCRKASA
jgi:CheY-like chemotaxis protein